MNKKIILLAMLFTASAIFISCDRNDDDPTPGIVLTSPETVRVYADQTTATNAVNFNATGAWTATVSYPPTTTATVRSTAPTWITIDRSSGNAGSNHIINITFTEINFSGEDRIAIITIRSGDTEIVITITQRGVDADNNIPVNPDNPYANLTQSQIVALLIASNVKKNAAPEVKILAEGTGFNSIQINRNQQRMLGKYQDMNGEILIFEYVEGFTNYIFSDGGEKIRETLEDNFWENFAVFWRNGREHFHEYTWTVSGRTFTGTDNNDDKLIITLDENEMFVSVQVKWREYVRTFTITYGNVNPTFPEGFNRGDFREEGAVNPAVVVATNVIGNTAGVVEVRAIVEWDYKEIGVTETVAQSAFVGNGFSLSLPTLSNNMPHPLPNEFPFIACQHIQHITISDNAARMSEMVGFLAYNSVRRGLHSLRASFARVGLVYIV